MKVITGQFDFIPEYDLRSICPLEEMLLFDIETTGLKKETTQLYLIGCAYYEEGAFHYRQYLTENVRDEAEALEQFLDFAKDYRVLLHFNGDGFDIPYLQYKCEYYETDSDLSGFESFDIYKYVRSARNLLGLNSLSQKSLEVFLGVSREDQLQGGLLIPVYYDYEKTWDPQKEALLLLHNHDDLLGMLKILPALAYGDLFQTNVQFDHLEETSGTAVLSYRLLHRVPRSVTRTFRIKMKSISLCLTAEEDGKLCETPGIVVRLTGDNLQILLPIQETTGRVPLENVADYYYLPAEDRVIHKDLAQFLDRSRKVRATRKNCFLKKEGRFIPHISHISDPEFYLEDCGKIPFADWDALLDSLNSTEDEACGSAQKRMDSFARAVLHYIQAH
ncbi:MAG: ribonuclease H-like domain-containing protein [Parasporobacterium sp.]|nr:ribonuclease H-like domain-containing protein [Parasporobacterium sp.]